MSLLKRKPTPNGGRKRSHKSSVRTGRGIPPGGRAAALRVLWTLSVVGGVMWGATRLEAYVRGRPEYQARPAITLVNVPEGLEDRIMAVVDAISKGPWAKPGLCRRMARALDASAWVKRVRYVRRFADRRVLVSCDYRMPAALVQSGGGFYAVGADGVRLPGRYSYGPTLVTIQGVAERAPEAGSVWPGGDLRAAVEIVKILHDEPFYDQISGIRVSNYRGRQDKRAPHIALATYPEGRRIVWGSAPGEEIEENTVDQKLALLRENFRRTGRIDAGEWYIDISIFPDRFTTRDSVSKWHRR